MRVSSFLHNTECPYESSPATPIISLRTPTAFANQPSSVQLYPLTCTWHCITCYLSLWPSVSGLAFCINSHEPTQCNDGELMQIRDKISPKSPEHIYLRSVSFSSTNKTRVRALYIIASSVRTHAQKPCTT